MKTYLMIRDAAHANAIAAGATVEDATGIAEHAVALERQARAKNRAPATPGNPSGARLFGSLREAAEWNPRGTGTLPSEEYRARFAEMMAARRSPLLWRHATLRGLGTLPIRGQIADAGGAWDPRRSLWLIPPSTFEKLAGMLPDYDDPRLPELVAELGFTALVEDVA